jgi:malonyl-CoA/methylmalonyl-CoA synthetase
VAQRLGIPVLDPPRWASQGPERDGAAATRGPEARAPAGEGGGGAQPDSAAKARSRTALPAIAPERRAQVFYTSGTTGRPKGAVLTHANLAAQIKSLVRAWEWSPDDYILGVLPLHHVHGVVNVLCCALWSGATCELMPRFDAEAVWDRFDQGGITLFMAVPTIYTRLIAVWDKMPELRRRRVANAASALRLMVSGSAALPVNVLLRWQGITGHMLLERYGMTEIGMALSNPLRGLRMPGHVGEPLPGVEVRLVDEQGNPVPDGTPGEIEVRGPGVFLEYLGRPEETRAAFRDGWFKTGDVAVHDSEGFKILGRKSVDIIKTGGYKVSALEIEDVLRTHPDVADCAVVGVPDAEWGEMVCAAVVPHAGRTLEETKLRTWVGRELALYKVPRRVLVVEALPRNAMGKVVKPELVALFRQG